MTIPVSKPIWVTGAAGFIGSHLTASLASEGHTVIGIGPRSPATFPGRLFLAGGCTDDTLQAALSAYGAPEAIYHLAGGGSVGFSIAEPFQDFEKSVVSTATILDFVRRHTADAAVFLASSAAVYGAGHAGPIAINASLRPYSPYGHHKRIVEQLGMSYGANFGLSVSVMRIFSAYGEGLRKQLLWDICNRLAAGQEIMLGGNGLELRDWYHVDDLVRAMAAMPPAAPGETAIANLGTGLATSVGHIARYVAEAWGDERAICFTGVARRGDPESLVAGQPFLPGSLPATLAPATGAARYVEWYRNAVMRS